MDNKSDYTRLMVEKKEKIENEAVTRLKLSENPFRRLSPVFI